MAKAKRKRKPIAATGKRQGLSDLLDIAPPKKPPSELERKKVAEWLAQEWARGWREVSKINRVLALPDNWALPRSRSERKNRLQPQQELCRRVFRKLFPDGRVPDEVERSTKSLRQDIETELEREAKQTGKRPLRTPSWDVVRAARRNP
jgi:hypothetical protein